MTKERMVEILTAIGSVKSSKSSFHLTVEVKIKGETAVKVSDISSVSVKLTESRSELIPMKICNKDNVVYKEKITKESRAA